MSLAAGTALEAMRPAVAMRTRQVKPSNAKHARFARSAVADAAGVFASGAALVMVGTRGTAIYPSIPLEALLGIEDANAVGACALHQVDRYTLPFLLACAHRSYSCE